MEERRRSTREPTYLHGVIYFNNGRELDVVRHPRSEPQKRDPDRNRGLPLLLATGSEH